MNAKEYRTIYKQILAEIDAADNIMMVMHQKPDGDTAGSCLAMANYLDVIGKPHTCFCIDELPASFNFLPGKHKVETDHNHWHKDSAKFDLLIVFDAGDLHYAGVQDYIDQLDHDFKIINIDHHATNKGYGDHNLVITTASSTCEIVHNLLDSVDALNKEISTCLMTGLITDTGHFTNLATTASSIETAGKLLLKGVNMRQIGSNTMDNRRLNVLKLWGRALERLSTTADGLVVTGVTQKDMKECDVHKDDLAGVANFLNSLDEDADAKAILFLAEREDGMVKGSMRTTHPLIDVSKLATLFGGGGHKKAAGFTVPGTLHYDPSNGWSVVPA